MAMVTIYNVALLALLAPSQGQGKYYITIKPHHGLELGTPEGSFKLHSQPPVYL